MKRIALILTVLLVAAAVSFGLLVRLRKTGPQIQTQSTFLGFTNTVAGAPATNALFGFKKIPAGNTTWRTVEISQWDGTNWQRWSPLPSTTFAWIYPAGATNYSLHGTVPLMSTSVATRVVIQLTPTPGKLGQAWQDFIRLLNSRGQAEGRSAFAGLPGYLMTNEFNPAEPVPQAGRSPDARR